MEVSTVIFFSLLLCGVSDVQAARKRTTLVKRVRQNEIDINVWKRSAADITNKMFANLKDLESSLKEELIGTFVPPLINSLVKQALTDILTEDFIGHIISGHVLDEVQSLKANVQNTKTQLEALAQQLRRVQRERDTYRKSLRKQRRRVIKDIHDLQLQLNETAAALRDARTTTYPGTTAASTDPSLSKTVPPMPVTTQDSHATPLPAADRRLYSASKAGDLETVKRILSAGHVDINTGGWRSRTPVMAAARRGHSDVVEFLVGRGANVSLVDRDGNNVLHSACYGGDLETVKLIVSLNVVDINSRGEYSTTPVMVAAYNGHSDVVELLVCRRANVSLVDGFGNNILHWACDGGDLETMKLIVSMNMVDINARNNDGGNSGRQGESLGTSASGGVPGVTWWTLKLVLVWTETGHTSLLTLTGCALFNLVHNFFFLNINKIC
ncbi:E3 ubiquitin-protein ligase mib1-like isoform X3 [Haliotis rubra]|uniref:E3 ubiquitin-protein ligase mib1-like isoform X3 n=1 Tax=Haliotis rubra TaxID=36100 RepID=UPI001EE62AC7|nr:E3 ubiquitin-protein ligase mib1-like isoform X3 [Haliotis rubra]